MYSQPARSSLTVSKLTFVLKFAWSRSSDQYEETTAVESSFATHIDIFLVLFTNLILWRYLIGIDYRPLEPNVVQSILIGDVDILLR